MLIFGVYIGSADLEVGSWECLWWIKDNSGFQAYLDAMSKILFQFAINLLAHDSIASALDPVVAVHPAVTDSSLEPYLYLEMAMV